MKLPKKFIKKAGGINKKAWRLFKASKSKKRKVSKGVRRKTSRKVATVAKKRRKVARRKTSGSPARRRRVTLMGNRTTNALINGAVIGGTAVGSTWAVNSVPLVKDQNAWMKALIQAGFGVVVMMMGRQLMVKKVGTGFISGAAISMILPYLPEGMKVFGAGRRLTAQEIAELQTMGKPYNIQASMGKPHTIAGGGGYAYSRGSRNFINKY